MHRVNVSVVGVGHGEVHSRVRRVSRGENETDVSASRVVNTEPDGEEPRSVREDRASGGFPGFGGALREPDADTERATTARLFGQAAPDEDRTVDVRRVVSADAPRLLDARSEIASVDQSTRKSKQLI